VRSPTRPFLRALRAPLLLLAGAALPGCDAPADLRRIAFENFFFPLASLEGPQTLAERMAELGIPGLSLAVIHEGEVHWAEAWGVTELGGAEAMTPETLLQGASISKWMTSIATHRLAEEGVLGLDQDVEDLLTSWQVPDDPYTPQEPATLRRILTHTAGFTVDGFLGYPPTGAVPTLLQILGGAPPASSPPIVVDRLPGSGFRYSGGGFTVLQQALEDATGEAFAAVMASRVLAPAGMARSTFAQPLPPERVAEAATGHVLPGLALPYGANVYPERAAAGVWTTPTELARLALSLQRAYAGDGGEILAPASARALLTPRVAGPAGPAGTGVFFDDLGAPTVFCHTGGNVGFASILLLSLDGSRGYVAMTNDLFAGRPFLDEVARNLALLYGWEGVVAPSPGC